LLTIVFHMLRDGTVYQDLGPTYLDRMHEQRTTRTAVRRLEALGYRVELQKVA
jgi:hypothetical protein